MFGSGGGNAPADRTPTKDRKAERPTMAKIKKTNKRCRFNVNGESPRPAFVDYKNVELLRKMMSGHSKIQGRRRTGNSAVYQRAVAVAIKRARFMGLLPYV